MESFVLLEDVEEVVALEDAIVIEVGAVDRVLRDRGAEARADRVFSDGLGDVGVVRAADLAEGLDRVLLSFILGFLEKLPDFEGEARAHGQFGHHLGELRDQRFVHLQELLGRGLVQVE